MVDALREAHRVLAPSGLLVDVRPVTEPLVVEVRLASGTGWAATVEAYSVPDDVAAAGAAVRHAVAREWFVPQTTQPFSFDIHCDSSAELRAYAEDRKPYGAEIPCGELDSRMQRLTADGQTPHLRCRRPWMLRTLRRA